MRKRDYCCHICSVCLIFFSVLRPSRSAYIGFHDPNEDKVYVWLNGNPIGSNVRISNYGGKHEYFQIILPEECLCSEITILHFVTIITIEI